MPSPPPPPPVLKRLEQSARSETWPPTIRSTPPTTATAPPPTAHGSALLHKSHSAPVAMPSSTPIATHRKPVYDPFEDDLNKHPEDHFLSPVQMYEYEDWAEDSDDDAEEIEWDAGITDFALFDNDRRHAQSRQEQVPGRWDGLLASQASALQRAVLRNRANSDPSSGKQWTPLLEDVPQLTPDNSPNLKGDRDIHSYCKQNNSRPSVPNYLSVKVTPPPEEDSDEYDDDYDDEDSDEDDLPVSFLVARARERRRVARQMERPGMRFNRTMSGKVHVWRRPSYQLYPVGEDAEAESEAEVKAGTQRAPVKDSSRGRSRR